MEIMSERDMPAQAEGVELVERGRHPTRGTRGDGPAEPVRAGRVILGASVNRDREGHSARPWRNRDGRGKLGRDLAHAAGSLLRCAGSWFGVK